MKYTCFFLLLWISISLHAQDAITISHYVFPEFQQGVVLMKNGTKNNARLNYNAASEEMVFEDRGQMLAIAEHLLPQIDTVFVANEKFIRLNGKFVKILADGLQNGLYVEHKCRIMPPGKPAAYGGTSQTSSTTSYSSIMSDGRAYSLKLPDDFKVVPYNVFWLKRNGKVQSFSNTGQLKRIYRDKKKMVDDYLKANDVKFTDEKGVEAAIGYLENH